MTDTQERPDTDLEDTLATLDEHWPQAVNRLRAALDRLRAENAALLEVVEAARGATRNRMGNLPDKHLGLQLALEDLDKALDRLDQEREQGWLGKELKAASDEVASWSPGMRREGEDNV